MTEQYNQFIAGAGIGGLLSASLLAQQNQKVFLAEKLPFFGGRFTSIKHHGFEIPTGAVHMIPHASTGPLGIVLLRDLNLPLDIIENDYFTAWYWSQNKPKRHKRFWGILKAFPKASQRFFVFRKLFPSARHSNDRNESFQEFLEARTEDHQIFQFFNAIIGFALSMNISQISTATMFRFFRRLHQNGRPGVPVGGCKAVTDRLVDHARKNGSIIQKSCELIKLEMDGMKIESAVCLDRKTNEEFAISANQYLLNLGSSQVNDLLTKSHIPFRLPVMPIAKGGGFAYRSKVSILKSSVVAQFPDNKYVKGAVEPTISSPTLAPQNEHLLLTHQVFHSSDIIRDTRRARNELLETFPQLKEEDELCVHTFHKEWPVNNACQGSDLSNFSSVIPNLFFVGDGYKGNDGWMMTEGVTHGVKQVVRELLIKHN
ncbi:MAG: FAD-dependent oxidoreductase [Candidatus Thorarchaeota archaeon]